MKTKQKPERFIDDEGKRVDGRNPDELRPVHIESGVLNRADGSCYIELGDNKIMAAVYGPREVHPRHLAEPDRAIVRYKYNMASFSVSERKRPGPGRRDKEISKVSAEALESAIFLEKYPNSVIDVFVEIIESAAGTRATSLTAASVACADAGIPMKDLIASCASGKVDDTIVLDVNEVEDNYGQADLPIAIMPKNEEITLLQMDGNLTRNEFEKAIKLAKKGCHQLYEEQKKALKTRYGGN
ncbi:exosome complex exonuclease Rrp41 [Methanonatronarchaeum sp. AMET-Sl]|uniref:exosome complex exonuclease Rrp41 n=1 Tax=Methanonatronarchaeum sp. AMET-Sl TaxID=3037654 RepID=UPI00244E4020|nr:exosome complex exonuclease Rrp41 [Methanonatronarchaeum sp. AMET-Sl]WGI16905.1 exosome complex exonuclease Rrp41 [Methanonatronarchaeum sp. AMET-Sl]